MNDLPVIAAITISISAVVFLCLFLSSKEDDRRMAMYRERARRHDLKVAHGQFPARNWWHMTLRLD